MNIDDVVTSQIDGAAEKCAVCGKPVSGGGGYTRIRYEKEMVALCCPLCLKTFQENPGAFVHRQVTRAEVNAIFGLLTPPK